MSFENAYVRFTDARFINSLFYNETLCKRLYYKLCAIKIYMISL